MCRHTGEHTGVVVGLPVPQFDLPTGTTQHPTAWGSFRPAHHPPQAAPTSDHSMKSTATPPPPPAQVQQPPPPPPPQKHHTMTLGRRFLVLLLASSSLALSAADSPNAHAKSNEGSELNTHNRYIGRFSAPDATRLPQPVPGSGDDYWPGHVGHKHHATCQLPGYDQCFFQRECLDASGCCYYAGACRSFKANNCHPEVVSDSTSSSPSQRFPPAAGRAALLHAPAPMDDGCVCATTDTNLYGYLEFPNRNPRCALNSLAGPGVIRPTDQPNCWGTLLCNPFAPARSLCKRHGLCRGVGAGGDSKMEKGPYGEEYSDDTHGRLLVPVGTFCYYDGAARPAGQFKMCGAAHVSHGRPHGRSSDWDADEEEDDEGWSKKKQAYYTSEAWDEEEDCGGRKEAGEEAWEVGYATARKGHKKGKHRLRG